jgi:hypothetical protein
VKRLKALVVASGALLCLTLAAQAASEASPDGAASSEATEASAPPKCLQAVVNPVTGFAICVNPKGAPVEPPPTEAYQRPCKPRAHDDDAWTIYEHASGCGD